MCVLCPQGPEEGILNALDLELWMLLSQYMSVGI